MTHLLAAGERALGRGDVAAAEQLLGRAMALLPADDPGALSAMPSLGQALYYGGQLERALEYPRGGVRPSGRRGRRDDRRPASPSFASLVRTHLDPEFAMRPALTEIESHHGVAGGRGR